MWRQYVKVMTLNLTFSLSRDTPNNRSRSKVEKYFGRRQTKVANC